MYRCWAVMQGTSDANILNAIGWCIAERDAVATAKQTAVNVVISMSLGGGQPPSAIATQYANYAATPGVMLVAAAGNSGANTLNWPAAFPGVVSVCAVDRNNVIASFSSTNTDVDICSAGVDVESWHVPAPGYARLSYTTGGTTTTINPPDATAFFGTGTVTGRLVSCGLATKPCPRTVSGRICLVDRGSNTFCEKVKLTRREGRFSET
jgi:subtilisin family serine protease